MTGTASGGDTDPTDNAYQQRGTMADMMKTRPSNTA